MGNPCSMRSNMIRWKVCLFHMPQMNILCLLRANRSSLDSNNSPSHTDTKANRCPLCPKCNKILRWECNMDSSLHSNRVLFSICQVHHTMVFNNFIIQWLHNTDLNLLILTIGNLSIETSQSYRDHLQGAEDVGSGVFLDLEGKEEHQPQHRIEKLLSISLQLCKFNQE